MDNVDKQNGNIAFSESSHTYWDVNTGNKYISVTTLIHKFAQEFDKDFWSKYKALEKLLPKEVWNAEKKSLLSSKRINLELLEIYNISENDFNKTQQEILDEWDEKNRQACERGTKIHSELENSFYKKPKDISLQKYGLGGKFECRKNNYSLDLEFGIYPEFLIYYSSKDEELQIAGQVDLIVKSGNEITIIDYKTNQKIDQKSAYNTSTKTSIKMQYPLNNLDDCNFNHYQMQLSTYAWMLQKLNPDFIIKELIIDHFDHSDNETIYKCQYLKKEVERMLYHHKKQVAINKERDKRKPIEY